MCHVFVRGDSLAAVAVSDHDYPPRVAHTMLTRYYFNLCTESSWVSILRPGSRTTASTLLPIRGP